MTPFREPPELSDDLYPGLSVWEERVTGSLTLKDSRLPLWANRVNPVNRRSTTEGDN